MSAAREMNVTREDGRLKGGCLKGRGIQRGRDGGYERQYEMKID